MASAQQPALVLAGFGAPGSLQLTLEAQQAVIQAGRAVVLGLPPRLATSLKRQGVELTRVDNLLAEKAAAEAYAAIAAMVLARAEQDPPAVFLSQGNPLFLNNINRYLFVEAAKRDMPVRVIAGVSPVDLVVNDLGLDVGRTGLLTIAASAVVRKPVLLSPKVPVLLLQVGALDASECDELLSALSWKYPADHGITLLNLAADGGVTRATVRLEEFRDLVPHIDASSMLFLAAAPTFTATPPPAAVAETVTA